MTRRLGGHQAVWRGKKGRFHYLHSLAWWDRHRQQEVGTEELYALATDLTLLPDVLGDGGDRSQRTKLGKALGRMRDRIIGTYRIVSEREDGKGRRLYRLEPTEVPT
jgi:hypothetical protein